MSRLPQILCITLLVATIIDFGIEAYHKESYTCDRNPLVNGCSVPEKLRTSTVKWYMDFYKPACQRHDVCYSCGATFGISRWRCDLTFRRDMWKLCIKKFSYWSCFWRTKPFHAVVRLFAPLHYVRHYDHVCDQHWVSKCVPYH